MGIGRQSRDLGERGKEKKGCRVKKNMPRGRALSKFMSWGRELREMERCNYPILELQKLEFGEVNELPQVTLTVSEGAGIPAPVSWLEKLTLQVSFVTGRQGSLV